MEGPWPPPEVPPPRLRCWPCLCPSGRRQRRTAAQASVHRRRRGRARTDCLPHLHRLRVVIRPATWLPARPEPFVSSSTLPSLWPKPGRSAFPFQFDPNVTVRTESFKSHLTLLRRAGTGLLEGHSGGVFGSSGKRTATLLDRRANVP